MTQRQTRLAVSCICLLGMATYGANTASSCDLWNTEEFFETATRADVIACLDAGVDVKARSELRPHSPGGKPLCIARRR